MAKIVRQNPPENGENGHVKHSEGNGVTTTTTTTTTTATTEKKSTATNNTNTHFVERVTSIPLVKDSVSTAQAIANKTSLGRFALSKANSAFTTVTNYAANNQPIQTYYQSYVQPHVERADAFGCRSLDLITEKVPIITQPSSDIYQSITQPPYQIIDGVKVRLDNTISTVTRPAHVAIQETNKRLGVVVDGLEGAVDKYLPASPEENNVSANNKEIKKDSSNNNQVLRVYDVLNEASRRITQKATEQVNKSTAGIPKSREDLTRLAENNAVIQNVTSQIRLLQETLVESITVYGNAAQEHLPASVTSRVHQTTELFTQVTVSINQQLGQLVGYVKTQSHEVPDWLKQKLNTVIESTHQQMELIKAELARKDINYIEKAKHVVGNIQDQILLLLQQISSQLVTYSETVRQKAQHELNVPLHYFGLNQKIKTQ